MEARAGVLDAGGARARPVARQEGGSQLARHRHETEVEAGGADRLPDEETRRDERAYESVH